MNKAIKKLLIIASVLISMAFVMAGLSNRSIEPNYSLKFSTGAAGGTFSGLKGTVAFYPEDLSKSSIDVSVDASTINTGSSLKDTHAKGEDWLFVTKYPLIKFTSSSFKKQGEQFIINGNMELHGVVKAVQIPFTYTEAGGKGIFSGNFNINRADYGVNGSGLKAKLVGDNIKITFNIPTGKV